jgi:membrane-anchored protein YejM (alkaline phosphatase superfamily)
VSSPTSETSRRGRALLLYAALTYAVLVAQVRLLARNLPEAGVAPALFFVAAALDSCLLYLAVAFAPVAAVHALAARLEARRGPQRAANAAVAALAVALPGALQIAVFADRRIYEIFGFHVNGFVMNLIATPGGIDSMGGDQTTTALFAAIALGLVALQAALFAWSLRFAARASRRPVRPRGRRVLATAAALLALVLSERLAYAFAHLYGYTPLLDAAEALPWYEPVTILGIAQSLGFAPARIDAPHFRVASEHLRYPLAPIARAEHPIRNIVWLVSESLRADMLTPEIMPATYAFARRALWFRDHYSGGNGTRMGMFTMFYGLHGSYWFPFLQHRRQPVLMDVLQQDGYQLGLFTSASFGYPEFDQTIFAGVPSAELHSWHKGLGWQRDRRNVGELLDFVERRDPARPFFAFLFFESPHARYYFPPESVIRRPYLEDLSYATMDLRRDMPLIFNRYVNACHHLDSQFARVLDALEQQHLLDSTIVVITGDHGEEFLEKGRWGHGSDFSEEQTRVPLVLWIPGESPREVTQLSSHADIPATLLARLGVVNPPSDYSIGFDLLGPPQRVDAVLADWNRIAVIDADAKLIFPMGASSLLQRLRATTRADAPLPASDLHAVLEQKRPRFLDVVHDLARFSARG